MPTLFNPVKPLRLIPTLLVLFSAIASSAQPLDRLSFLAGEWVTNTETDLGRANAVTTFAKELDGNILARRSVTTYTSGKSAGTKHEDLLIFYTERDALRAIYFDGEGHVIRYNVSVLDPATAVLESDASSPGPRFRLTHKVDGSRMETKFEIAPPGQTAYKTYVSGVSTRK